MIQQQQHEISTPQAPQPSTESNSLNANENVYNVKTSNGCRMHFFFSPRMYSLWLTHLTRCSQLLLALMRLFSFISFSIISISYVQMLVLFLLLFHSLSCAMLYLSATAVYTVHFIYVAFFWFSTLIYKCHFYHCLSREGKNDASKW